VDNLVKGNLSCSINSSIEYPALWGASASEEVLLYFDPLASWLDERTLHISYSSNLTVISLPFRYNYSQNTRHELLLRESLEPVTFKTTSLCRVVTGK